MNEPRRWRDAALCAGSSAGAAALYSVAVGASVADAAVMVVLSHVVAFLVGLVLFR